MKISHLSLTALALAFALATPIISAQPELAKPSAKQLAFADWEVGAFFHYNLNPFTGMEHGDGQYPASMFAPTELNVEQWIRTAKAMGARYAVLTARHEGGFCLWPTKTTDYSIANSPYLDGKGDLVREFVDLCRKYDLKVGLYHTAGFDAHEALKDYDGPIDSPLDWDGEWGKTVNAALRAGGPEKRESFKQTQIAQMRELLTGYGQIDFMWSDHWNAKDPDGVWRAVTDLALELQPDMVFMGTDTWVPGNETGHVVYPMWNATDTEDGTIYTRPKASEDDVTENDYGLLENKLSRGDPFGKFWRVRECTTNTGFHYGGWFWHPDDVLKTTPRRHWEHIDLYYRTVGLGANTIINLPVDTRGLVPDEFVEAAEKLGQAIEERFSTPIAETDGVIVGNVAELRWDEPRKINTVVTMENIANGQRIAKYVLEARVDGEWQALEPQNRLVAEPPYESQPGYLTIGHKKIDRVKAVITNAVRLRCLGSVAGEPEIRSIAVFDCPPIEREFDASYPYLSGVDTVFDEAHRGMKRDISYEGHALSLAGQEYERGLLLCPSKIRRGAVAEFDLRSFPKARGLSAMVGIDDATGDNGSAVFIVETQTNGEWQELYRSAKLTGESTPESVQVAFPKGATMLRLLTTDAGDGVSSDHAAWADAKFTE